MDKIVLLLLVFLLSFTALAQRDFSPSFSPDGKEIVFYRYVDKVPELMIIRNDGSELKQITKRTGLWSIGPRWSKDKKYIFFSQGENMGTMDCGILNLENGEVKRIKKDKMQFLIDRLEVGYFWASRSDKGFEFYISPTSELNSSKKINVEEFTNYWVYKLDKNTEFITVNDKGKEGLYFRNKKQKLRKVLGLDKIQNLQISNDRKYILFEREVNGNSDIFMANSDGSKLQRLTIDKSKDFMPAFSPDNKSIVFSSSRTGAFYLYKMDLKSRKISPLTGVKNTKLKWVLTEINSKRLSDHSALYYMFDSTGK